MKNTASTVVPQARNSPGSAAISDDSPRSAAEDACPAKDEASCGRSASAPSAHRRSPSGQAAQKSLTRACTRSSVSGSPASISGREDSSASACSTACTSTTISAASSPPTSTSVTTAAVNPRFSRSRRRACSISGSSAMASPSASRNGSSHTRAYRTPAHTSTATAAYHASAASFSPYFTPSPPFAPRAVYIYSGFVQNAVFLFPYVFHIFSKFFQVPLAPKTHLWYHTRVHLFV